VLNVPLSIEILIGGKFPQDYLPIISQRVFNDPGAKAQIKLDDLQKTM
jgi:hypothetical protein